MSSLKGRLIQTLTLISLEALCLTESMFTMMVGWREKDRTAEAPSERESDVRIGGEV